METIVIITECRHPNGKYWEFSVKETGQVLAEVDKKKRSDFDGPLYFVYTMNGGFSDLQARRSNKDTAIALAKRVLREQNAGMDIVFKWNILTYKYKWN